MTLKKLSLEVTGLPVTQSESAGTTNTKLSVSDTVPSKQQSQALEILTESHPLETDKRIISSIQSFGIILRATDRALFPDNGDVRYVNKGFRVHLTKRTQASLDKALRYVEMSMTPMPEDERIKRLTLMLMMVAKPSGEGAGDLSNRIRLYSKHMADWPADIFLTAVLHIEKNSTFWPAFSELNRIYEIYIERRQNMLKALQNYRI